MAGERARLWPAALGRTLVRQIQDLSYASPLHQARLDRPRAVGLGASPRDARPIDPVRGRALMTGRFILGGETLEVGVGGDPWNRPSPSRAFAERLHRFDWVGDLVALGEDGAREALRLTLDWKRVFGRWNGFSWRSDLLERRVFNLACAAETLTVQASDWEKDQVALTLARQARHLLGLADDPPRAAERLTACAVAGVALTGSVGQALLAKALPRLNRVLAQAVLADGGHATRSPQAGLELLFDLLALDDGLTQSGHPPVERISRAIDQLTAGVRFFTLPDGRLAQVQGGEAATPSRIAAALAHDAGSARATPLRDAPFSGYQRLAAQGPAGAALTLLADSGALAEGAWSVAACAHTGAIELTCGRDRLIGNCGWSPLAHGHDSLRLSEGASTVCLGAAGPGAVLKGYLARALGPRLVGAPESVSSQRRETETGVWLEISHGGWVPTTGLVHERRLYLDKVQGELRGEDRFAPEPKARAQPVDVAIRFHLAPHVRALVSRDQRSVLLRGPSSQGWWLRHDASEVAIEPSVRFKDGVPEPSSQIVLRGRLRADHGGRVRWKLAVATEPTTEKTPLEASAPG